MTGKQKHCYDHPRPSVSVDLVIFRSERREILLIRRGADPYKGMWALPGGFVDEHETVEAAAARELAEETGLSEVDLEQLAVFSDPDRDPRGRTISVAFTGRVGSEQVAEAGDDADALWWFPLDDLPELAFDHDEIIDKAVSSRLAAGRP